MLAKYHSTTVCIFLLFPFWAIFNTNREQQDEEMTVGKNFMLAQVGLLVISIVLHILRTKTGQNNIQSLSANEISSTRADRQI